MKQQDQFKSVEVDDVAAAVEALHSAFVWADSREGHKYWSGICDRRLAARKIIEVRAVSASVTPEK